MTSIGIAHLLPRVAAQVVLAQHVAPRSPPSTSPRSSPAQLLAQRVAATAPGPARPTLAGPGRARRRPGPRPARRPLGPRPARCPDPHPPSASPPPLPPVLLAQHLPAQVQRVAAPLAPDRPRPRRPKRCSSPVTSPAQGRRSRLLGHGGWQSLHPVAPRLSAPLRRQQGQRAQAHPCAQGFNVVDHQPVIA